MPGQDQWLGYVKILYWVGILIFLVHPILKSGAFALFALQKVLGNFCGFVKALKVVQCVVQVDGKTLGCSSPLGYSYLSGIKHSYSQVPQNLQWLVFLKVISAVVKLWNWIALLNQCEWECDMNGTTSKVLPPFILWSKICKVEEENLFPVKMFSKSNTEFPAKDFCWNTAKSWVCSRDKTICNL